MGSLILTETWKETLPCGDPFIWPPGGHTRGEKLAFLQNFPKRARQGVQTQGPFGGHNFSKNPFLRAKHQGQGFFWQGGKGTPPKNRAFFILGETPKFKPGNWVLGQPKGQFGKPPQGPKGSPFKKFPQNLGFSTRGGFIKEKFNTQTFFLTPRGGSLFSQPPPICEIWGL